MTRDFPFLRYWRRLNAAVEDLGGAHVTSAVAYAHYARRDRIEDAAIECAIAALVTASVSAARALKLLEA